MVCPMLFPCKACFLKKILPVCFKLCKRAKEIIKRPSAKKRPSLVSQNEISVQRYKSDQIITVCPKRATSFLVVYSVTPKPPADKKYECSYQIIILECFHLFDNYNARHRGET